MASKHQNKTVESSGKRKQIKKLAAGIRDAERVGRPDIADDLRQRLKLLAP